MDLCDNLRNVRFIQGLAPHRIKMIGRCGNYKIFDEIAEIALMEGRAIVSK